MDFLISLTALCLPISIAASSLTLFPLLGIYILGAYWTFKRWPPHWGRAETSFSIFYTISVVSALFGASLAHSRHQLIEDLYIVILPLTAALLWNRPGLRLQLLKMILLGGLITAVVGLLQAGIGINRTELGGWKLMQVPAALGGWPEGFLKKLSLTDGRATGLRSHPLAFAETLLFPLAYLLSALSFRKVHWLKWGMMMGVLVAALLVSQSRGPWIAFGIMVFTLALLERHRFIWIRLAFLITIPLVVLLSLPHLRNRATSIGDTQFSSNSERLMMWQAGAHMLRDHPLLGIGPGNVKIVSPRYQTPEQHQAFGAWGHLHNTYVQIGAERGILGLSTFLFFIMTLFLTLLRTRQSVLEEDSGEKIIVLTALLSLIGWLVSGLTEALYNNSSIQMLFYFVVGIALSSVRLKNYWRA